MEINIEQNNMMHLNNGGFAYDGFFRYSGVSLYSDLKGRHGGWSLNHDYALPIFRIYGPFKVFSSSLYCDIFSHLAEV